MINLELNDIDIENIYISPTIYNVLNESRGISNECYVEANIIASALRSTVNNGNSFNYIKSEGKRIGIVRNGSDIYNVFGQPITIKWIFYNFDKREFLNKYYELIPKNDYFNADKNILSVTLFGVSGNLDTKNCENSIGHEIFHFYKSFMPKNTKEKELSLLGNKVSSKMYEDNTANILSNILYLISKEEIQAFCNGAYNQIKKEIGNVKYVEDYIENTILFTNFKILDKLIHKFIHNVDERIYSLSIKEIERKCNITMMPYNSFVKYMENGRNEYLYQIGRLKSILIDDFKLEESNIIFEKYF